MIYSVPYKRSSKFKYFDKVDEIIVIYNRRDITFADFIRTNRAKTIVVSVKDINDTDLSVLEQLYDELGNIKIRLDLFNESDLNLILKSKLPFFFQNAATCWAQLSGLLKDFGERLTDVYIVEELGFDLIDISRICKRNNVLVRVVPYLAQSAYPNTPQELKFFIRPEDTEFYSKYIDVFEFVALEDSENVYYEIYAMSQKWYGPLGEIILGAEDIQQESFRILQKFAQARVNCKRRCDRPNSNCNICKNVLKVADSLKEKEMVLVDYSKLN